MNLLGKIALVLLLFPSAFFSQEITGFAKQENARFVIKTTAGIPKPISSNQFRKSFSGFYDMGISVNIRTVGNVYFGIGYQNIFLQNNRILKQKVYNASIPYNTHLLADCPFATFSYDRFFKKMSYVSYSLHYGYLVGRYTNVNNDTSLANKPLTDKSFSGQFIKPEVSFNFIDADNPWVSFSVVFGYTTLLYKYDPKAPHFNHFEEISKQSNRYYMSWFSFGFGLNILLARSKE